jgi:3D (Asp-Asp-Asp) domain-containing protein
VIVIPMLALAVLWIPFDASWASHYAWLGHDRDLPPNTQLLGAAFVPTIYRILDEAAPEFSREAPTEPLHRPDGSTIAIVGRALKRQLDLEGSVRLRDGRIVNVEQKVKGKFRYLVVRNAPFGVAMPGFKLVPYRTISVDPRRIKLGTVLYVPALAGIALPSGDVHDGFCFAHDTGQGIVGNRVEIFVGFEHDLDNALTRSGRIASFDPLRIYRVDGPTARAVTARFKKDFAWNE